MVTNRTPTAEPDRTDRVGPATPGGLTVFYDGSCELCRRCRAWLETQRTWVPLRFLTADATTARHHLGDLPWLGTELVVVADDGQAWVGPAAFLTCLWATVRYRPWSYRLSGTAFAPLAERFFLAVSTNRGRIGAALGPTTCDENTCRHRDDPFDGLTAEVPWSATMPHPPIRGA